MPSDALDQIAATYAYFIWVISLTVGLVLIFVSISFRSIFVPLRAILTIALTICFVYGFADLTYEFGILNWTHFAGVQSIGALSWIVPLFSFSLMVGMTLDYEIFLLVRVREFRMEGWSTPDSIVLGLYKTGSIITAAGIIMSISFSGLLFSNMPVLNQLSFFLMVAVLFDTFVVRTMVVPAVAGLLRDLNWWPGKVPSATKPSLQSYKS